MDVPREARVRQFVLEHVYKSYAMGSGRVEVLKDLNATIPAGEIIALLGRSGSGKSTLLHLLGALDRPTSGKVFFGNEDLSTLHRKELASFRNSNVGFVFQFHHLLPEFNALENVLMPQWIQGGKDGKENVRRATRLLERLGLGARQTHLPAELSGGEQQRVAIARALMNRPKVLLADEPTGNLDEQTSEPLMELLRELNREEGVTLIIATHDKDLTSMANVVLYLRDGKAFREK